MRSEWELAYERLVERGFKFSVTYPAGADPLMNYSHAPDETEAEVTWLIENKDRLRAYLVLRDMDDVDEHRVASYARYIASGAYTDHPKRTRKKRVATT